MKSTIITALIMVGSLALIIFLLVLLNTVTVKENQEINSRDHLIRVVIFKSENGLYTNGLIT